MRTIARSLAAVAVAGMVGGQAFGQGAPVVVRDSPVHGVPADAEPLAPPETLNAQYAALSAAQGRAAVPQSRGPDGPTVAIAPMIVDAAGAFAAYMRKGAAIDPNFADGAAVARAVSTGSGYEIEQFQEGIVAYAALAALQEPDFVQAVYDAGRDARDRDEIAGGLLADPKTVLEIEGADKAAATVSGVLAQMGIELLRTGQGVRKAAYDVQHQAWSKEAAPNPQERLAQAKKISATRTAMSADDTTALMQSLVAMRKAGASVGGRAPAPTPVVLRGLAVAALAVLGRAGDEDVDKLTPLLSDAKSADCMKMAKLNLYQCLAVAGPHYEHAFCLGQHALMDTGQCVIAAAGQSQIPAVTPVSAPVKPSRSVSVPVALGSPAGPERAGAYARPPAPDRAPPRDEAAAAPFPAARDERADRDEAPPPRQSARDEAYDRNRAYDRDQDYAGYGRQDPRYDGYYDDGPQASPRDLRQDYDPYDDRYGPPVYAYRFGR
ncbi:MAG TPA: hypothetical protein VL460_01480 [Caulobacteraceae bacterium]|jgi:hypothetical protein|nr:hypothetical protein [Caulobacteraceae bacterium]